MSGEYSQSADEIAVKNKSEMKADPAILLNVMLSILPLHAEEGRQRESILEADIVSALIAHGGATEEVGLLLVYTLRRQL